jgi:hypothetical protein
MANGKQYGKRLGRAVKRRGQRHVARYFRGQRKQLRNSGWRLIPVAKVTRLSDVEAKPVQSRVPTQAQEVRRFMRKAREG